MTSAKIVVWEWLNKFGKWCPYTRNVCQHLEQAYSKNLNSVWLGDCDILLKNFTVNLKDMLQVSERSGTTAAVRRQFCDEGISAVVWQWRGDHHVWHCYNADIADIMENAFQSGKRELDLSSHFSNYPYKISFLNMVQKNKRTKHHRPIQRITSSPYPVSNLENGFQEQANGATQLPSSDVCDSDAVGACAAKPTEKTFIMKQVSAFWNKFKKSVDSDSNVSSDEVEELSVKKKQCTAKNTSKAAKRNRSQVGREVISPNDVCLNDSRNRNSRFSDADMQFATVNGKVWKYPSPPSTHQSLLKPVPGIDPLPCDDRRSKKKTRKKSVDTISMEIEIDVIDQFTKECSITPSESGEEQVCIICYESLLNGSSYDDSKTLVELQLCSHIFHKSCVKAMYDSGSKDNHLQCPTCKTIHGVKCGSQPQGTMVYHVLPYSLPGYPECDTIRIIYDIPAGFQGPEHPHPGHHYTARGFPRHCYLPDNEMGRKVIRLLIKAWERKLIFTIGMSSTTGEENTVTWNEIHHKTEFGFNRRGHGFPDPNYFENIIAELAAHGVTESTYAWTPA